MRTLSFLSLRLRFLRGFWLLPQLVETLLLLQTLVFHRRRLQAMETLFETLTRWPGVTWHLHRFGGKEFRRHGRELAHLHGNGVLDLPLTRARAEAVIAAGLAQEHHTYPGTGWVSLQIETTEPALTLLRQIIS